MVFVGDVIFCDKDLSIGLWLSMHVEREAIA